MEDYCNYYRRASHQVPAFGSWDWNNDLPFTQCFETARQAGNFLHYTTYSEEDLYVAGDLYQNDVVTPTIIAVPRNTKRNTHEQQDVKGLGDGKQESWVVISGNGDVKATLSPINHQFPIRQTPKPVDEDLYKLDSPDLLYAKRKKKGVMGFISNCLLPSCVL